jgi:N-acyl-D-aspartate/D-glutamate deacylase
MMMERLWIRNVRIFDGSGAPWQWGELLVEGSTIKAMGKSTPPRRRFSMVKAII